nr:hypothetical protein [Myxococcota bacterium]
MTSDTAAARRHELIMAGAAAALLVAQQVAGKATRDALFLTAFDPRRLPIVMASGAVLSLLAVLAMSRAMAIQGPARTLPAALVANSTFFIIEWIAAPLFRDGTAVAVYLHVAALGSVLISGFWTLTSERFDPNRAKRHFSRIAAGGTLGGVIGGVSVEIIAGRFGARAMLLVLAIASLVAAGVITWIGTSGRADEMQNDDAGAAPSAFGLIARKPYLRSLGAMSLLAAVWAALLDFAFKAQASRVYEDDASLVSFFAWFYTGASIVTFVVQSVLGRAVLHRVGLPGTIMLLPLAVAIGGLGLLFGSPFPALVAVRAGESVISNSLYRAAYEQLFTPLSPETKRPTKMLVDVAATRIGDALGALLVLALIYSWYQMPVVVPVVVAAGAALFSLLIVPRLANGYVEALRAALRGGTVAFEEHGALDATTRRTLSDTAVALDRERLLREIEALRRAADGAPPLR